MPNTYISDLVVDASPDPSAYLIVDDGTDTKRAAIQDVVEAVVGAPPKRYVALLSQSGTDAPVATVLENTLGGTPVFSREDVGIYEMELMGAFAGTLWVSNSYEDVDIGRAIAIRNSAGSIRHQLGVSKPDNNTIYFQSYSVLESELEDGLLSTTPIEIRVYET